MRAYVCVCVHVCVSVCVYVCVFCCCCFDVFDGASAVASCTKAPAHTHSERDTYVYSYRLAHTHTHTHTCIHTRRQHTHTQTHTCIHARRQHAHAHTRTYVYSRRLAHIRVSHMYTRALTNISLPPSRSLSFTARSGAGPTILALCCGSQAHILKSLQNPTPYTETLHLTPYTLHQISKTLHPTPCKPCKYSLECQIVDISRACHTMNMPYIPYNECISHVPYVLSGVPDGGYISYIPYNEYISHVP